MLLAVAPPAPARAATTGEWWRAEAIEAANLFATLDDGHDSGGGYADMAGGYAYLYGWTSTYARTMYGRIWADRNPDGGWGLGRPYDAFNDGSVNPASTSYSVTTGGICQKILAAWQGGIGAQSDAQWCVNRMTAWPRVHVARGQCVSYSTTAADAAAGCVHNVSAAVAWFLVDANAAGLGATGMQALITGVSLQEAVAYRETLLQWPYISNGAFLDTDHDSYTAEAVYRIGPYWIGREVAYKYMLNPAATGAVEVKSPIVHTRLAGLPGGPGSWSRNTPGKTLWCEMSDRWRTEQDAYLHSIKDEGAAGQFFYLAARAARACA